MSAIATLAVSATVGVWLMFAPAVLGYGGAAAANDRIVGPVAAAIALVAMAEVVRAVRLVDVGLGAWLVVAAFTFPYDTAGTVSAVASGIVLALSSLPGGRRSQRYGGGWREVMRGEHR